MKLFLLAAVLLSTFSHASAASLNFPTGKWKCEGDFSPSAIHYIPVHALVTISVSSAQIGADILPIVKYDVTRSDLPNSERGISLASIRSGGDSDSKVYVEIGNELSFGFDGDRASNIYILGASLSKCDSVN